MAAVLVASNFRPFSFVHTSQSTSQSTSPANIRRPNCPFYHHYPTPTSTAVTSKFNLCRAKSDGFWERSESVLEERGEEDDEVEEEEGVEVIFEILQSFFRKVSRKAKKAARSVLPPMIPSKLLSFAVDGFILLALLSTAKALLEVACNLVGMVFLVILLARTVSAVALHYQSTENQSDGYNTSYRTS